MTNTAKATSHSGHTIRPSFKCKAAELGEKTEKAIKKVFKEKKSDAGEGESKDSPHGHDNSNPLTPSLDTDPASPGADPIMPQVIDLIEPEETEAAQPEDDVAKLS